MKFNDIRYMNDLRTVPSLNCRDVNDIVPLRTANLIFEKTLSSRGHVALYDAIAPLEKQNSNHLVGELFKITCRATYFHSLQ